MQEPVDWEIRHGRDEDVDDVVELLRTCLGEGGVPRTPEFWRWKHQGSPFGPSPVLVAAAGGRIVAVRAFLRWVWHESEREVRAVRAVDTATHPDWQGRGIFSRLTRQLADQMSEEGVAFVFNTPNRKSGGGYRKMGWKAAGRLPVSVRLLRLPGVMPAVREDAVLPPVSDFLERPETGAFLAAVDRRRGHDPRLRTAATATYLRWRYAEAPGLDYRASWAGTGATAGAIVLRMRQRRGRLEASISEILVAGAGGTDTAAGLLRDLRQSSRAVYALAIASPETDESDALRRAGFLRLPASGPRLVARPLSPAERAGAPFRLAGVRLAAGSFELF